MNHKTFEDFGLTFNFDPYCMTCSEGNCHNIVTSKQDGREYHVHISTDREFTVFNIQASENSTTEPVIDVSFEKEEEAVEFVCKNFEWFKCF